MSTEVSVKAFEDGMVVGREDRASRCHCRIEGRVVDRREVHDTVCIIREEKKSADIRCRDLVRVKGFSSSTVSCVEAIRRRRTGARASCLGDADVLLSTGYCGTA